MNRTLRRTLKFLGWTAVSIVLLLLLVVVLIQVPAVQNFARKRVVSYLEGKLHTKVAIGRLSIDFPKKIVLENVYFEDQNKDTLIAGQRLAVDLAMFQLLHSRVELNDIELKGIRANIYRKGTDSFFNYEYIVKAFTSPTTTAKPADTNGVKIDVSHIVLERVTASFRDDPTGSDMYMYIGDFETHIKKFDLDHNVYNVPDLRLQHVIAKIYQHKPPVDYKSVAEVKAANTGAPDIGLTLGPLKIADIDFDYVNDVSELAARVKLGNLNLSPDKIDLPKLEVALKNFELSNTDAVIRLGNNVIAKEVVKQVNTTAQAQAANPWKVSLAKLTLANNHIKFDNNNQPRAAGMDYAHMDVKDMNMEASNLAFTPILYTGDIAQASFSEQCGFRLHNLQTSFLYDDHGVQLKNLYLETDKSLIRDKIIVAWPSLDMLATNPGEMLIDANIARSRIAFSDVLMFAPMLAPLPPFYKNGNAVFALNGQLRGYVKDLEIPNMEGSGMQGTAFKISGRIKGLPDAVHTTYNINIANLRTTAGDLEKFLPAGTIPPSVRIPEALTAHGFFTGSMNAFTTKLSIGTTRGNAELVAGMRNMTSYNVAANLSSLDLGYITKQPATVGKVTGRISAIGSGFDPKTMVATIKANLASASIQGYAYRNISLDAKLNRGNITAGGNIHDPNISLSFDATSFMKGTYPSLKLDMQLDSIKLQPLHFYSGDMRLHGHIAADLQSTNPDALLGTIDISNLVVYNSGKRYAASDTIRIASLREAEGMHLSIRSEAVTADLTGQYKLTQIGQAVEHTINKYYNIPGFKEQSFTPQQWTLAASIKPSPLLFTIMPEMNGSDSINALINYNSVADDLKINTTARKLVYGTNRIDSLNLTATTAATLNYALTFQEATNGQYKLNHTSVAGDVANNQVSTAVDVKDQSDRSQYQLAATLNQVPYNGVRVALANNLMLDYTNWSVGTDNFIQYDDRGVVVHNLSVSNGAQSLAANSQTDLPTAPIDVRFANFSIGTVTRILNQDSTLVGGIINGTAQVRNPTKELVFTSDLAVKDLSYKQDTVGDLVVKVNNETAQTLAANIQLQGHGNDIRLDGRYYLTNKQMDMNLDLNSVSLSSIKPFSGGQLQSADGALRGKLAVSGTLDKPGVNGTIRFDSAHVVPTLLGERFALTNEAINVNATGIHFNNFTIADSSNNKANIDGDLLTSNFKTYQFNLNLTADHFRAVNSKRGVTHKPFYGSLVFSTNTKIRGDMNLPVVTSYVRVNKNTDFSYVLPANDPEVQTRVGVVEFVDMSRPRDTTLFAGPTDSVTNTGMRGMDVAATIETDSAANFNLVIDERNGDAIHIRGIAALQAGVDRSGKVSLTGSYTMQDGSYLLTLSFLKRQFTIKPGSTITWDGDPTLATVDITAIYVANTAPIDLVEHQLAGRSPYEVNQYKQNVPFNVLLQMKGELMKPQITFDIVLPEREAARLKDVDAKLAQVRTDESEMNKQVFALLLLGHFVDENPLSSNGTPNTAESFVRQSASRILTDQLNRLAGNLIKGVDLNFGINSGNDYSTGELTQRTDLTVGVSKRLLNDRLKVNVGSSFGLEGPTAPNQQASNIAGDVSLDYQVTKDGRYVLRAYRRNDYEGMVEGQVIETGATLIYKLEYDNIRDFFRKPRRKDTNPSAN